eukprot:gnl/Dysnectes_brevis/263_a294_7896.p2 GENE.gnl/Dysnectes_brevis/263_a294_7896~~gnl/Dysnectes_brevis/263_a294_7896.p2  ORF type:complete len:143 (-),score=15.62 gnl/Dysnectes_brevis/263_a294_7896:35-463(-)
MNKTEKKARSAIDALHLPKVEDVTRITLRRGPSTEFTIYNPEVYHNVATNTYIIFGVPQANDFAARAQELLRSARSVPNPTVSSPEAAATVVQEGDEILFSEEDVKLVMEQGSVSEEKAKALLVKNGDIVSAVLAAGSMDSE